MGKKIKFSDVSSESDSRIVLDEECLRQIMDHSHDPIFVTDKYGNCLLNTESSSMAARTLGISPHKLVGENVKNLVETGVYDWSPTIESIETGIVATGLMKTRNGSKIMATSTPIKDKNGEVIMVVTNIRDKDLVEKYSEELEREKTKSERYKTAIEYLSEVGNKNNTLVAESPQMQRIFRSANIIAKTDSTVMLCGESGTGKEVLSRYIHRNSQRTKEPFIPVNCAAIPPNLFESEFFGYVRGAFTGANAQGKLGLFEIAHKGTLFLDEISELPLAMQSKLLRVLETGEIQRIGSTKIQHVDVRLIVATNRDLKERIDQELFRSDLYYRLNVIPISLPPLRERHEDIVVLAHKFLKDLNSKYDLHKMISPQTIQALINYSWPGNIRELRNVIEREVITSTDDYLNFKLDGVASIKTDSVSKDLIEKASRHEGTLKNVLRKVEVEYIHQILNECHGKVGEAAQRLGIHRTMLYRKTHGKVE